jgi:hypothetical protein
MSKHRVRPGSGWKNRVLAETEREKGKKALLALASERRVAMRQKFVLISGVTFSRERECSK